MPSHRTRHRPEGLPTRGKTAPNRLRRLDTWLVREFAPLIAARGPAPVVDLGFGEVPSTTLELALRFRGLNGDLSVVGVEIDRSRVEAARASCGPAGVPVQFVHGGFEVRTAAPARLVRALNVLRQYPPEAVAPAWAQMAENIALGGLLVEGTSDPTGQHIVVELLKRVPSGLRHEGVLFATDPAQLESPMAFKAVLPKRLIHRVVPGEPVHALFDAWQRAWERAPRTFGRRQRFGRAAEALTAELPGVGAQRRFTDRGFLLWRPPDAGGGGVVGV